MQQNFIFSSDKKAKDDIFQKKYSKKNIHFHYEK
jgi:hypothetical protein